MLSLVSQKDGLSDEELLSSSPRMSQEECGRLADTASRLETGIKRININIGKNERMIQQAEADKSKSARDAASVATDLAGDKAADLFKGKVTDFLMAKDQLQKMKLGLDKMELALGTANSAKKLSKAQIRQARVWIANGMKYGDEAVSLATMAAESAPTEFEKNVPLRNKITKALDDFNRKFMNEAGGWEFAGEHLAEYGGGPLGKFAFKTAVIGIKLQVAAAGYLISNAELGEYKYNLA
ncbi:MAG TPA: hypothetical protein VJB59_04290 [Bdellovibrionota bacterium]|nr:hypothetical protein [Bdellovibrionota bacterium]